MRRFIATVLLSIALPALAVIEAYEFETPEQRERFQRLTQELRCPKCQNQNIADSDAPIAKDLRYQLHKQLQSGADDESIKNYMVQRYGEFVLYKPRMSGATLWLWAAPALMLLLGAAIAFWVVRRQHASITPTQSLSVQEQARMDALFDDDSSAASEDSPS